MAETDWRHDEGADDDDDDDDVRSGRWADDDADEGKEGEHGGDEDACGASGAERRWRARLRDLNRESEQRHASERNDPYAPVHVGYLIHLYTLPRFSQLEDSSAMPLAPQRL